jgi:hypothetical protein
VFLFNSSKKMAKKRRKKQKAGLKATSVTASGKAADYGQTDEDGRLDFGGLPERDLKKNLGCG